MRLLGRKFWVHITCSLWPAARLLGLIRPLQLDDPLVRIGPQGDGGYLLPSRLQSVEAVFSPGVALSSDFELVFAKRGVPCFLIDGSVDSAAASHTNLFFDRLWLGTEPLDRGSISLEEWVETKAPDSNHLLLQMDIEGAEWAVVSEARRGLLKKFEMIVIEIHNLGTKLKKTHQRAQVAKFIRALTRDHFVAHFHPNNCCPVEEIEGVTVPNVVELTLLRKNEWMPSRRVFASLPHQLDIPNVAGPDIDAPWR